LGLVSASLSTYEEGKEDTMVRIPGIAESAATPEVRAAYAAAEARYGVVPASMTVKAHHPEIFQANLGFEVGLARAHRVEGALVALAEVKAAALVGCPF
jgi:hypothetical protein